MIYLTRQEQRIVILFSFVLLISTGISIIMCFQPVWISWLSMNKPAFNVERERERSESNQFKSDNIIKTNQIPQKGQDYRDNQSAFTVKVGNNVIEQGIEADNELKKATLDVKIDINTASKEELEMLPYIGVVIAQNIIDYRKEHGKFTSIEQINNVKRIGDVTFLKIKDYITINGSNDAKSRVREIIASVKRAMRARGEKEQNVTYAIAEVQLSNKSIETWISCSGSGRNVPQYILDTLRKNVRSVSFSNKNTKNANHAEKRLLGEVKLQKATIIAIGATNDICETCEDAIVREGYEKAIATFTKSINKQTNKKLGSILIIHNLVMEKPLIIKNNQLYTASAA